jgi:hypothetical protein
VLIPSPTFIAGNPSVSTLIDKSNDAALTKHKELVFTV